MLYKIFMVLIFLFHCESLPAITCEQVLDSLKDKYGIEQKLREELAGILAKYSGENQATILRQLDRLPPVWFWGNSFKVVLRKWIGYAPLRQNELADILRLVADNGVSDLTNAALTRPLTVTEKRALMLLMDSSWSAVQSINDGWLITRWLGRIRPGAWLFSKDRDFNQLETLIQDDLSGVSYQQTRKGVLERVKGWFKSSPKDAEPETASPSPEQTERATSRVGALKTIASFMQGNGDFNQLSATLETLSVQLEGEFKAAKGLRQYYKAYELAQVKMLLAMLKSNKADMIEKANAVLANEAYRPRISRWVYNFGRIGPGVVATAESVVSYTVKATVVTLATTGTLILGYPLVVAGLDGDDPAAPKILAPKDIPPNVQNPVVEAESFRREYEQIDRDFAAGNIKDLNELVRRKSELMKKNQKLFDSLERESKKASKD